MLKYLSPVALIFSIACAHVTIPGTEVPDNEENRAILNVLADARTAMIKRDADALLSVVSTQYFETMGTPDDSDDYGYQEFKSDILPKTMEATQEMSLDFRVLEIQIEGQLAHADIRYKSRAHVVLPSGSSWNSNKEFSRIHLANESGKWRIISGL
ncbi:MAG: nuclear transport factor 2 family protein [Myxococcota bacterium]|nr:nuclear transport factor 2 family protein [Myxococcota bacterium]